MIAREDPLDEDPLDEDPLDEDPLDEDPLDEDPLDEDFPLGDGTADSEATVLCPYCAEEVSIVLDPGSGATQSYVEDCPVCCQPWQVRLQYSADGTAQVFLESSN